MKDLSGRVAVVTGAASGIGRAMAERFAAEGMKLALADVDESGLAKLEGELRAKGAQAFAQRVDVSRAPEVEALAARTYEAYGAAHVVCNNAGVAAGGFSWDTSLAEWEWVVGVNLWGVIHGVRAFVPRMLAGGDEGHIVNTASIAGLVTPVGMPTYVVTKHGVVALTESLFHELAMASGGKLSASVLCPGWVQTRIADSQRNSPHEALEAAKKRAEDPVAQQMGAAVRHLVSQGIAAESVAGSVVDAVREGRFYVLTHPEMTPGVRKRMEAILEGKSPASAMPR